MFPLPSVISSICSLTPSAAASATLSIRATQVPLRTTTGTQDITIAGFGTPKAAMFIASHTLAIGTQRANLVYSTGATDGASQWVCAGKVTSVSSTGQGGRRAATDEVVMILTGANGDTPNVDVEANFDSWITDGVRINVGATTGVAYYITVILFGGSELSAAAGAPTLATTGNTVTVTPGFETNVLFTGSDMSAFGDSSTNTPFIAIGMASFDGTTIRQACQTLRVDNGNPIDSRGEARNDSLLTNPTSRNVSVENITSTAFDLRSNGGDFSAIKMGYLALSFSGSQEAYVSVQDSPTTTGDHDFTGPSFTPSFAMTLANMLTPVNTFVTTGGGGTIDVSILTGDEDFSHLWYCRDNVSSSNAQTLVQAVALNLDDHTGAAAFDATFVEFASGTVTLNFTAANGTARKWPMMMIGA